MSHDMKGLLSYYETHQGRLKLYVFTIMGQRDRCLLSRLMAESPVNGNLDVPITEAVNLNLPRRFYEIHPKTLSLMFVLHVLNVRPENT